MSRNESYDNETTIFKRIIYSDNAVATALVFCVLFVVFGVLGNFFTVAAILKSRKLRHSPTSVFIVSLSVADLIFCAFNLPLTAVRYYNQKWILGTTLCKLFPFFFYLNVAASLFNMVAITVNRYVMIAHYHRYDSIYRRCTIALMIAFCWAFPIAMLAPTLAEKWGRFGYYDKTFSCTILRHNGSSPKKFLFVMGFFVPCSIIIVSYLRIFCVVRSSRRNVNGHDKNKANHRSGGNQIDEMALTYTVLVIFCAFVLCYLPLMIANVFDDNEKYPVVHVLASVLAWASAVVNPFVYGFMSRRYREAYAGLFTSACARGRWAPGASNSSTRQTESVDTSVTYSANGNVNVKVRSSAKNDD